MAGRTWVSAVAAALVMALAGPALAQDVGPPDEQSEASPEAEALGIEVSAGYAGLASQSDWLPVEVRMHPRRPARGTIAVAVHAPGGPSETSREFEAAAGSRSVFRMLVPAGRVDVRVHEEGRRTLGVHAPQPRDQGYVIGRLDAESVPSVPLRWEPTGQTGAWAPVAAEWLDVSSWALEPLSALVADASDLAGLSPQARRNLATAVVAGTDLVVVADAEGVVGLSAYGAQGVADVVATGAGPVRSLVADGPAWSLTLREATGEESDEVVALTAPAGRGRVSVVGAAPGQGPLGAEFWSQLVSPGIRPAASASQWNVARNAWTFPRLLADQRSSVPRLPWLSLFLVAYVVIVGPVSALVLARTRRRELAWATVPMVAVVFAAGAYFSTAVAQPVYDASARVGWWIDGLGAEVAVIGLRSPSGGLQDSVLPGSGWTVRPFAEGGTGARVVTGADTRVVVDLRPLQLGGFVGSRPTDAPPPLDVRAVAGPDGVDVTVVNRSADALDGLALRAGTAVATLGRLEAGAQTTATIGADQRLLTDPYADVLSDLHRPDGMMLSAPRSLEALLRSELIDGNTGLVWAIGWTEPDTAVESHGSSDRGALQAVAVTPQAAQDAPISPHSVARAAFTSGPDAHRFTPLSIESGSPAVLRYRLPPGAPAELYADLARGHDFSGPPSLAVWDHAERQWTPLDEAAPDGWLDSDTFASAFGEVHVQASGDLYPLDFGARVISGFDPHDPQGGRGD